MAYAQSNDNSEVVVLNTGWEFSQAGTELWRPAQVPGTVHQVPYCHEDTRPYYDLSPASCLMHRQVGEQWVSYQHSLAHYAGPWLYDENISCPTEER